MTGPKQCVITEFGCELNSELVYRQKYGKNENTRVNLKVSQKTSESIKMEK
jgi:hypothetical protein